jgi:hypothetical protein
MDLTNTYNMKIHRTKYIKNWRWYIMHLETLKNFGKMAEEIAQNPTPYEYWIKEDEMITALHRKQQAFNESIKMSYKKFNTPFTI